MSDERKSREAEILGGLVDVDVFFWAGEEGGVIDDFQRKRERKRERKRSLRRRFWGGFWKEGGPCL